MLQDALRRPRVYMLAGVALVSGGVWFLPFAYQAYCRDRALGRLEELGATFCTCDPAKDAFPGM